MSEVSKLSQTERLLLSRADQAVDQLSSKYESVLIVQLAALTSHFQAREWSKASDIVHMIAGEAGSFDRPYIGEIAELIRLLLDLEAPQQHTTTMKMLLDGLNIQVKTGVQEPNEETDRLVAGLRSVVSLAKSSIHGSLPNSQDC